jgi:antitoxin component of MazEF toxin-antitoxin module
MVKKLSKHGNSLAVLIDKPILDLLGMDEHSYINIRTDGTNIIIEPIKADPAIAIISKDPRKQKIYQDLIQKYDAVLRKLAKN